MSQAKRVAVSEIMANKSSATGVKKSQQGVVGSVPVLSFPASIDLPNLMSLTDKRSAYASVARTCLQLNQFAGSGSSAAATDDTQNNALFHDASFAKTISASHAALIECAKSHDDRRCRILACKTLALVARSAYARLRHSPLLFSIREGTLHRLEDEVGTDVPVALCSVALEDADDGVSACAVEALGMLTLCNAGMAGTSVEDGLLREMEAIAHARPSPNAPTLMLLQDDDFSTAQLELQSRVYENVLSPRLWRLIRRILHFGSISHIMRAIPFLTACLGHLVIYTTSFGMDRPDYAKRWVEIDVPAMVDEVVSSLLIPSMQQIDSGLAHCAALCTLRLADTCPAASWIPQAFPWIVSVLVDEITGSEILEQKMANLSALMVALRAIPLRERTPTLEFVANEVRFLPSTTRVPKDVVSSGIKSPKDCSYRRPARIGLLSEIAVSFFVDDENADDVSESDNTRSKELKQFLSSTEIAAILTSRSGKKAKKYRIGPNQSVGIVSSGDGLASNAPGGKAPTEQYAGIHVSEELVLSFCQVASRAGKRVMMPRDGNYRSSRNLEDWLRCSLAVLFSFSACINWRSRTTEESSDDEDHDAQTLCTVLAAAQGSYITLLQECVYTVGLLSPVSSVSLHVMPLATPRDFTLLEQVAQATFSLSDFEPVSGADFARSDLVTLVDQFLEYKLREGVPSRHVRMSLLALLTDHWVQSSHLTTAVGVSQDADEPAAIHLNELNAREILTTLSQEISTLSREINKDREEGQEAHNTMVDEQYLKVCVACVENMALTACDWTRRFGGSNEDLDEDARYIISVALAALDGKNLREGDTTSGGNHDMIKAPICIKASKRIQDVASAGASLQADAFGIGGEAPALYSSLVVAARLYIKSGIEYTPYLSESLPTLSGDTLHHAHLTQYCQQVVGSRFDLAIWSSPLANSDDAEINAAQSRLVSDSINERQDTVTPSALRIRNPLRLMASSKHQTNAWKAGERMCWNGSSSMVTAGSDPVAVVLAYVARRTPRYDCEPEYFIGVSMKMHNITAVEIAKGVRLGLSVTRKQISSPEASTVSDANDSQLFSTSTVYKQEVKAGDHLMWEVSLPHLSSAGSLTLHPSVTFRETDTDQSPPKWVGKADQGTDGSGDANEITDGERLLDEDEILDVTLPCESVPLTAMAALQPCPLVFFRHDQGEESVFRFLYLQLPYRTAVLNLVSNTKTERRLKDHLGEAVAKLSSVTLREWVSQTEFAKGWAFSTLTGSRLFCVMTATEAERASLQVRADDEELIKCLIEEKSALANLVSVLASDKWRWEHANTEISEDGGLHVAF